MPYFIMPKSLATPAMPTCLTLDQVRLVDTPLSDQVYDVLRAAILSGELKPNERLVERELANRLKISRTPIREAISRLDQEGYVAALPTRGVIVNSFTVAQVEEMYGIRAVLEGYAARRAAVLISAPDIEELEEICAQSHLLLSGDRSEQQQIRAIMKLNARFHDVLEQASGSDRLHRLIDGLRPPILTYRVAALRTHPERERSTIEHYRIVQALKAGDVDGVERMMRQHAYQACEVVLSHTPHAHESSGATIAKAACVDLFEADLLEIDTGRVRSS